MDVRYKGALYAQHITLKDCKKGQQWHSDNENGLQVSTWRLATGHRLQNHIHRIRPRESKITEECIVVISGSVKTTIFDEDGQVIGCFVIFAREMGVFLRGGHGFEITDNDTKVVEIKNGPFTTAEEDKIKI